MAYGGGGYQGFTDEPPRMVVPSQGRLPVDGDLLVEIQPQTDAQFNHVENLDAFFRKVYEYHQKHGYLCMVLDTVFYLLQFLFTIIFVTFLFSCVDYAILFRDKPVGGHNTTEHIKVKLKDGIIPPGQCIAGLSGLARAILSIALTIWLIRVVRMMAQLRKFREVRVFYTSALKILPQDLHKKSWAEVQQALLVAQKEQKMSVHDKALSELDIYHRILRHENFLVALVTDCVIPVELKLPFIGTVVFLSSGYRYNLEAILFWSPWAPFQNDWHLKEDYKKENNRLHFAKIEFKKGIMAAIIINLILTPVFFVWQLLSVLFSYADIAKREPGLLGARMWSEYSRVKLRHYNELDHELNSRLCRGYRPAVNYVNSFTSHTSAVIAKNMIFFAGSFWVVLVGLTLWDEDFLSVEHIMTTIAILSVILAVCRSAIPDEHVLLNPEEHKMEIVKHIHYDHGEDTSDFAKLFTYKFSHLLCEVLSPFIMPYMLLKLYTNSDLIVDFFSNNTESVNEIGDVCSYAKLDLDKHGTSEWMGEVAKDQLRRNPSSPQAEQGKVELSLTNFKFNNPKWMPESVLSQRFLDDITFQAKEMIQPNSVVSEQRDGNIGGSINTSFNPPVQLHLEILQLSTYSHINTSGSRSINPFELCGDQSFIMSVQPSTHSVLTGGYPSMRSMPSMSTSSLLEDNQVMMSASALVIHSRHQRHVTSPNYMRQSVLTNIQEDETRPLLGNRLPK